MLWLASLLVVAKPVPEDLKGARAAVQIGHRL